jgi:anti-anti-sigma factor
MSATPHVVHLRGEYDAATVDELAATLAESIAVSPSDVIVDLSEVRFLSVAAVEVFIRARKVLEDRGESLVLSVPSRSARRMLDRCRVAWRDAADQPSTVVVHGATRALESWVSVPATTPTASDPHIPAPNAQPGVRAHETPLGAGEPVSRAG